MNPSDSIYALGLSLAIGLLIGLERGWHEREADEGMRVAGVRTYGLLGFLGGFAGLIATKSHIMVVGFGLVGVAAALAVGYAMHAKRGDAGITSLVAGILVYLFGAATTLGYAIEAAMAAVATTLLLSYKPQLHRGISKLEPAELRAALKLLAISVVILPVLPNESYGPWGALNPFEIWWMVVLIAGISFGGYFAMKIIGAGKGAILTGLLAGLASSTALTLSFARLARSRPNANGMLAIGVLVACGTMFPRMLIVASLIHQPMFTVLLVPAAAMTGVTLFGAAFLLWREKSSTVSESGAGLKNPLDLGSAILFGLLLAFILVAAKGLESAFGEAGIVALAGISGLADVDAITLSLAKLSRADLALGLASFAIILACAVNSIVKAIMTMVIAGPSMGFRVALPLAVAATAGLMTAGITVPPIDVGAWTPS